jgi:hypothetical protein
LHKIASRRKEYAADLVEEMTYDHELRFKDGKELRPMHLQTADSRMSASKAKNWDMYAVCTLGLTAVMGSIGLGGNYLWRYRAHLVGQVMSLVVGVEVPVCCFAWIVNVAVHTLADTRNRVLLWIYIRIYFHGVSICGAGRGLS